MSYGVVPIVQTIPGKINFVDRIKIDQVLGVKSGNIFYQNQIRAYSNSLYLFNNNIFIKRLTLTKT